MVDLVRPDSPELWAVASRLVREYAASLDVRLDFQDFDDELAQLASMYGPPGGVFLLAQHDGQFVGCGGIRRFSEAACEMKRLYVAPGGQNQGFGRMLAIALIDEARRLGYKNVLLDTLPSMNRAQALYTSLGFVSVESYRFNPVPGTTFMRLDL
jgi:carbonic anhydrase